MKYFRCLIVLVLYLFSIPFFGQDNILLQKDTLVQPQNIDELKKNKTLRSLTKWLIKKDAPNASDNREKNIHFIKYKNAQNKIIRNIFIQSNDPFGYDVNDSLARPEKKIERIGNSLHGKTKISIINDYLLFKEGEVFDSLKVKESERLLRETNVIRRINITAHVVNEEFVDVYVRTVDSWSMIVTGSISTSKVGVRLRERNFLGVGHYFDNRIKYDFEDKKYRYTGRYHIPNIYKTYISFDGIYHKDYEEYYTKGISFQRKFFSPLTRWAGGISLSTQYFRENLDFSEILDDKKQSFDFNNFDYWAGYAFQIESEHGNYNKITNLIISGRYNVRRYKDSPDENYDPDDFFASHNLLLAGVGITSRGYYKDQFIFKVAQDEDIPIGRSFMVNVGNEHKNDRNRLYLGAKYTSGNKYSFGYLGATAEYGTFLSDGKLEQSVLSLQSLFYTNLFHVGSWHFRHFLNTVFMYGYNRFDTQGDMLSLHNDDYLGIVGFNSENLFGTQKLIFSIQSQAYSPWSVLGFRMSPFANITVGMLGDNSKFVLQNKVYPSFSLGVLLTNDFLVFSNIQLSFTYFPRTPGKDANRILFNTLQNYDLRQLNYEIGRPETVKWNKWY